MNKETDANLEINLGQYIEIIFRQWRLISIILFVCAATAAVVYLRPPNYEANVLVATTKIASSVTFGSSIETLSEGQLPVTLVDRKARLQSYVALVSNPVIAERVYLELEGDFGDEFPTPESLLRMVSGTVLAGSDAVEIKVSNTDPVLAGAIANSWGRHYVDHVNNLYAFGSVQDTLKVIQRQANDAHAKYIDAEKAYSDFLGLSSLGEYTRIREEMIRVNRLLIDAQGLLQQVENGGDGAAASNALAVSILKTQAFASYPGTDKTTTQPMPAQFNENPITLQFQTDPVTVPLQDLVADIKSLVTTLDNRSQALMERVEFLVIQEQIQPASASIDLIQSADGTTSARLEDNIRMLTSRIEQEEGRRKDLSLTRDLAWDAYKNLATKEAELVIASQTGGQEVVLGSIANVTRNGSSLIRNVALAALAGLMLGIFTAIFIEYWWGYKGREPQALFGWNFESRDR